LFAPSDPVPARDDVVVCRCEEVTAGEIRNVAGYGGMGPNQVKSFLRCGMGLCQGRMCGPTVNAIIARQRGVSHEEAGYVRIRPPIKPIPLKRLAAACLATSVKERGLP